MTVTGVLDAAAALWPGADVQVVRHRSARVSPGALEFALLPSGHEPRLAVPLRPLAAGAAIARRHTVPASVRARARAALMSAAFGTGTAGLLTSDRLVVRPADGPRLDRELAALLGRAVTVGIRVGPPRANRKPVLQVVDTRGAMVAFVKLGVSLLTDALVEAETAALNRLAGAPLGPVQIPAVLHAGRWGEHPLLVQAPLPAGRAATELSAAASARLSAGMLAVQRTGVPAGDLGVSALQDLGWWQRSCAVVDRLPPGPVSARLAAIRDRFAGQGERIVPCGAWHGDWNAGNCSVTPAAVLVWDWERYETGVPAGFDALHLSLQSDLAGGVEAGAAQRLVDNAARITSRFGVPAADATMVCALYLWGLAVRYQSDGQDEAGAAVGRLESWLLPVLEHLSGEASFGPAGPLGGTVRPGGL